MPRYWENTHANRVTYYAYFIKITKAKTQSRTFGGLKAPCACYLFPLGLEWGPIVCVIETAMAAMECNGLNFTFIITTSMDYTMTVKTKEKRMRFDKI